MYVCLYEYVLMYVCIFVSIMLRRLVQMSKGSVFGVRYAMYVYMYVCKDVCMVKFVRM